MIVNKKLTKSRFFNIKRANLINKIYSINCNLSYLLKVVTLLFIYIAYPHDTTIKTIGTIYIESVFSILNIDNELINWCVIIHGKSDLLL